MTVLLTPADLEQRRRELSESLRGLARSLTSDLERAMGHGPSVPPEKARLTRGGGRCEVDGVLLEFDPYSPRAHRCPSCGRVFDDESHYRWWVMGYQLWLAERAVHAASLFALMGDDRHRDFASAVLEAYVERYLEYPNRDNVLGPTRVFFSTYLESIWLLQLIVALDLLEMGSPSGDLGVRALGQRVRDRIVEPSASLIAGYDEALSNRQVWNNAAMLAASRILGRELDASALDGTSGLRTHLRRGLLVDGTWYEGENYHLFAHRGLWYGVTVAATANAGLDATLLARFDEAFATPFVTALPDFTFPSRRDSQYRVSLRQWRFAELAELGLARSPADDRLRGALATLYDGTAARGDAGRWRSTAEAERNSPAVRLQRSDLGWRSLLYAVPTLPPLSEAVPKSALLAAQGLAILRRNAGRVYVALDYGHSGAGHGHPDRLNLMVVNGEVRWLDDVGTGSYVDPSLHWYRSTLAHNAPLVDGRSQSRVDGTLAAYEDRGGAGWVRAIVHGIAPDVRLERSVVVMPDYIVDELAWSAGREVTIDLPFHVDGELSGAGRWSPAIPPGGSDPEDGFRYLRDAETATADGDVRLNARCEGAVAVAHVFIDGPHAWWRAVAHGPPGESPRRFHFVRATGRRGSIATVWDLSSVVARAAQADGVVTVELTDGSRHEHRGDRDAWHVALTTYGSRSSIDLGGAVELPVEGNPEAAPRRDVFVLSPTPKGAAKGVGARTSPLVFELGEPQYRRSEDSWRAAGSPTARVSVGVEGEALVVRVDVCKQDTYFAPRCDWNPLDNEHPDTNSDGVQVQVIAPLGRESPQGTARPAEHSWLLVPEEGSQNVRVTARTTSATSVPVRARWSPRHDGYHLACEIPLGPMDLQLARPFLLSVIVNDMSADRERRRGQLVLGGSGGHVYLRGDRHSTDEHLAFRIADE